MFVRRRPTLPHPGGCSTIGAGGLSFRVRDVSGRFPAAMAAVTLFNNQHAQALGWFVVLELHSGRDKKNGCSFRACLWSSPRPISTSQLNTLPCLHFWPINPVVLLGALTL